MIIETEQNGAKITYNIDFPNLSAAAQAAFDGALCKRGERKGLLLANPPKSSSDAYAAWSALMFQVNPYKVHPFALMMMNETQRKIGAEIETAYEALTQEQQNLLKERLDKDSSVLRLLGAW